MRAQLTLCRSSLVQPFAAATRFTGISRRSIYTTKIQAMKASWEGVVIAESNDTKVVEGNHYFPPHSIKQEYFTPSSTSTVCGWKGVCSYYNVEVNGKVNKDAAWYYPDCKPKAKEIENYVAFWKGVQVSE